ncbi:hypothetical protein D9615_010383 [Tricholomella constricta]|uniref:Uncharacterized protein n=1 Tax=Tricholomella constricta TaxID=117010 RepID=A0A8H5LSX6_9AGAR|nr:hypothetical protein D9615_010383 [Tricholomella constricta]
MLVGTGRQKTERTDADVNLAGAKLVRDLVDAGEARGWRSTVLKGDVGVQSRVESSHAGGIGSFTSREDKNGLNEAHRLRLLKFERPVTHRLHRPLRFLKPCLDTILEGLAGGAGWVAFGGVEDIECGGITCAAPSLRASNSQHSHPKHDRYDDGKSVYFIDLSVSPPLPRDARICIIQLVLEHFRNDVGHPLISTSVSLSASPPLP